MFDLIEEFNEGETVYIQLDTNKNLLYGEYKVHNKENRSMKHQHVTLRLMDAPKKARYFRKTIELKGFRIEFNYTPNSYKVYDDYDDMVRDFCRELNKNPETNLKLFKKLKNKHPTYFI